MRKFTPEEDKFLLENYLTIPINTMSKMLGRGKSTAGQRLKLLGVIVPKEISLKFLNNSLYKKGHIPSNTGKKQIEFLSPEAIERTKRTRFHKGNLPKNTYNENNIIVTRKNAKGTEYYFIKLGHGKWLHLHVHLWKMSFGDIPKGNIIRFKDSNPMNCTIDNLEMITRAEQMLLNTIHNYPEEIKASIRLISKLNKTIRNHGSNNQ